MLKILWIFLGVGTSALQSKSSFVKVTRGNVDSVNSNIPQTSVDGLTCDTRDFCDCKDRSTATYIFDSMSLTGKCVRDYEISSKRSNGKFLPYNGKCIGVTDNEKVENLDCRDDDLSVRWIWTFDDQMFNFKALKCLKVGKSKITESGTRQRITQLMLEQCDTNNLEQKWGCKPNASQEVENERVDGFTMKWIIQGDDSYFQSCNEAQDSYQGCYRFSDGNFMTLIDKERCDTRYNDTCGLNIKLQAPIATGYTSCRLDWTNSEYTISGYLWTPFNEVIEGVKLNMTLNPLILQIENKSSVISKWQGHLFRLYIKCSDQNGRSESHCALLKIQGSATEQIPISRIGTHPPSSIPPSTSSTTSSTTSPTNSTPSKTSRYHMNMTSAFTTTSSNETQYPNINSEDRKEKDNLSIILPVVISAIVLFCLLLAVAVVIVYMRRKRKTDSSQNEEHVYEETHPVDNGPVSPIYMEIDEIKRRSKKSNGSRKTRSKSQASQEPPENPFYHTLERPDGLGENVIYEELDEVAKPPSPKDFEKELDV